MVRTEIRIAAVLQGVWLPTSLQAAVGQVKAMRQLRPETQVAVVPSPPPQKIDIKA